MSLLDLAELADSLPDSARTLAYLGGITFVGAGVGNPNHLTLAAVDAIAAADVIILDDVAFDEIVQNERLTLRESAQVVARGDADLRHLIEVETALIESGLLVVRLIAGDTLTNTGCHTEANECFSKGLFVELLPGLTEFTAVPHLAGVQLQPNQASQFVVFSDADVQAADIPSSGAAFFMITAEQLPDFVVAAMRAGRLPTENCLVTFHGATTSQHSTCIPLAKLSSFINRSAKLGAPSRFSLAIGVSRDVLTWYESQPLFGWRILLPRTKESDDDLVRRFSRYGAVTTEVPTVAVEPPRSTSQLEKAISGIVDGRYVWVVFTSVNAVRAVNDKLLTYGLDARAYSGLRVAAVGSAAVQALEAFGIRPDLVPEGPQDGQSLAAEFPVFDEFVDPINRVLIPRAEVSTDALAQSLVELGWEIDDVTVSRTVRANPPAAEIREAIKAGKFDAVFCTSSSAVRNLVGIAGKPPVQTVVAAIGSRTAATCEEHGLEVDVIAAEPTVDSLLAALLQFAEDRRNQLVENGEPVVPPSKRKRRRTRAVS